MNRWTRRYRQMGRASDLERGRISTMTVTIYTPGLILKEREFDVPFRCSDPDGGRIAVFARRITAPDGARDRFSSFCREVPAWRRRARRLVRRCQVGWAALKDFCVLVLDQRGTAGRRRSRPSRR